MSLFDLSVEDKEIYYIGNAMIRNRIPINASVFLTNACNFRCHHCYVQSLKDKNTNPLTIDEWELLLRELKASGCIYLTISGGEALCSPIFLEFYQIAYNLNFQTTVISNLSLLDISHVELFAIKKPKKIITSLYGFSEETYSAFCGVQGMFEIVKANIELLLKTGINLELQTIVNTMNFNEIELMYNFAKYNDIKMNFFRNITCEIDGNNRPLAYRISPEQEKLSYDILHDKDTLIKSIEKNKRMWDKGYKRCFAGITNCYIDYQGSLFLCNHMQETKVSTKEKSFEKCWDEVYSLRKKYIEKINPCSNCKNHVICGKCTPSFEKMAKSNKYPFPECNYAEILIKKLGLEIQLNEQ